MSVMSSTQVKLVPRQHITLRPPYFTKIKYGIFPSFLLLKWRDYTQGYPKGNHEILWAYHWTAWDSYAIPVGIIIPWGSYEIPMSMGFLWDTHGYNHPMWEAKTRKKIPRFLMVPHWLPWNPLRHFVKAAIFICSLHLRQQVPLKHEKCQQGAWNKWCLGPTGWLDRYWARPSRLAGFREVDSVHSRPRCPSPAAVEARGQTRGPRVRVWSPWWWYRWCCARSVAAETRRRDAGSCWWSVAPSCWSASRSACSAPCPARRCRGRPAVRCCCIWESCVEDGCGRNGIGPAVPATEWTRPGSWHQHIPATQLRDPGTKFTDIVLKFILTYVIRWQKLWCRKIILWRILG